MLIRVTVLAALALGLACQAPASGVICDSSTGKWGSVFVGLRPHPQVREMLAAKGPLGRMAANCLDSPSGSIRPVRTSALQHLLSWFRVPTVHAQGCGQTSCKGLYMFAQYRPCLGNCNGDYNLYYSNPRHASYDRGYQDAGSTTCCGQRCAESGCQNW